MKSKKGLEMQYIIIILLVLLFVIFAAVWYFGIGESIEQILNSIWS